MQIIRDFLHRHQISDQDFALGVSGGADSLALALMFHEEMPDLHLIALTVDHQLRPSSRAEAEYVSTVMKRFGIEHHILTWKGEKPLSGIEECARNARYDLLCGWCLNHGVKNLAIAHHQKDQAETFLMRLQRGSGVYGLASMSETCTRDGINILRPLLNIPPTELRDFLTERGILWMEDESNQCTDYLRVKIRKFLPIMEKETGISIAKICTAATNLQRIKSFLQETGDNLIRNKIHQWRHSGYSVDYAEFLSWHQELKFYILGKLIADLGEKEYMPEADSLLTLAQELGNAGFEGATLGGCLVLKSDLRLWLIKEIREPVPCSNEEWELFLQNAPEAKGLKIPAKLKLALLNEKLSSKI